MRGWEPFPAAIGLGFFIRGEGVIPGFFGNLCSARTYGGLGAGSTAFWVDPSRDLTFSFLSVGLMEDSYHLERVSRLSDIVVSALVDCTRASPISSLRPRRSHEEPRRTGRTSQTFDRRD